ncbi:hypothetical protein V2W45_1448516, partial [Cenococcum geophilum]
ADRHVASSKSLGTELAGHLEECENLEPSLAIEFIVQHITSNLARLSTYYPTVPMRLRKDDAGIVLPPNEPNPTKRSC